MRDKDNSLERCFREIRQEMEKLNRDTSKVIEEIQRRKNARREN